MTRAIRTRDPVGAHDVTLVDGSGRVPSRVPLYGSVWGEFRWVRTHLGGYWEPLQPRPHSPLHPLAVAAAERRAVRASRRAAVYARGAGA